MRYGAVAQQDGLSWGRDGIVPVVVPPAMALVVFLALNASLHRWIPPARSAADFLVDASAGKSKTSDARAVVAPVKPMLSMAPGWTGRLAGSATGVVPQQAEMPPHGGARPAAVRPTMSVPAPEAASGKPVAAAAAPPPSVTTVSAKHETAAVAPPSTASSAPAKQEPAAAVAQSHVAGPAPAPAKRATATATPTPPAERAAAKPESAAVETPRPMAAPADHEPPVTPMALGRQMTAAAAVIAMFEVSDTGPNPADRGNTALAPAPDASALAQDPAPPQPSVVPAAFVPDGAVLPPSRLSAYDRATAVYEIASHTVYLPDGTRLEAHSGLGARLDDPASVKERMRGATPPNVYEIAPLDNLFHGVRALRLNPLDDARMFGRDGILAHTYMLGPRGDSNGCVVFKDYRAFLKAFDSGLIQRLAVVAHLN